MKNYKRHQTVEVNLMNKLDEVAHHLKKIYKLLNVLTK